MSLTRRTLVAALALAGSAVGMRTGASRAVANAECLTSLPDGAADRVTLTAIAAGPPLNAPGQSLQLFRFALPPGEALRAHSHPGATILQIESGQLAYPVIKGSLRVWSRNDDGGRVEQRVEPGETVVFGPGDSVFYDSDTTHRALNPGEVPVSVLSATLILVDQPQSMPARDDTALRL